MNPHPHLAALALVLAASAAVAGDDKGFSMGIEAHSRAEAVDVGLPVYAGAVPFREGSDDKAAAAVGAWAGRFGLRVDAMKFRTTAPAERVAAFYAKAMSRHGDVLDCRDAASRMKPPKDQDDKLSCDGREPKAGEFEFRVGTAKNFRVVSVKPDGGGTRFDMARVELRH